MNKILLQLVVKSSSKAWQACQQYTRDGLDTRLTCTVAGLDAGFEIRTNSWISLTPMVCCKNHVLGVLYCQILLV